MMDNGGFELSQPCLKLWKIVLCMTWIRLPCWSMALLR
jgi:hypothetical protein